MKAKYTIRKNKFDNWYGYEGGRKVKEFFAGLVDGTQEQQAKEWLLKVNAQ